MSDAVETKKDIGSGPEAEVKRWMMAIEVAEKKEKKWRERSLKIIDRYRDEKERKGSRFNILWSNTETLQPALYLKTPKPDVRRRFRDRDPLGKKIAEILERCLSYSVDDYDFDEVAESCVEDYLLPGRGQARVRYIPSYGDEIKDADGKVQTGEDEKPLREVVYEEARCEYVDWRDFLILGGARKWREVSAIAFRGRLTRDELREKFPKVADEISLDDVPEGMEGKSEEEKQQFKRAVVWEIWDKESRQVIAIAPGYKQAPLSKIPDPLGLKGFFPCPRPLYSVETNNSLVPIPEFTLYQDQADELDKITARIDALVGALKLRGIYDASVPELESLLRRDDNEMVAVADWARIAEKGGIEGILAFAPVEAIAKVLLSLYQQREGIKQTIYEITGISDIVRGATNAQETATAQRIKGQFASLRLERRQKEVNRFLRDLFRLKAEIIAEHFDPQTLALMTGEDFPTGEQKQQAQLLAQQAQAQQQPVPPEVQQALQSPSWDDLLQVMRQDGPRSFRIDIETDTTIAADLAEEQKNMTDLLSGVANFITAMGEPVVSGIVPIEVPKAMLLSAVRHSKMGREVEDALEQLGEPQMGPDGQPVQKPDPNAAANAQAQAETEGKIKLMQAEDQRKQAEHQRNMEKLGVDLQIKQIDHAIAELNARVKAGEILAPQEAPPQPDENEIALKKADVQVKKATAAKTLAEARQLGGPIDMDAEEEKAKASEQRMGQTEQMLQAIAQQLENLGQVVSQLAEEASAPVELVKGQDGRVAGLKKGKRTRNIRRGPDGSVIGLQ